VEIERLGDREIGLTPEELLFSESNGRLLLEVQPEDAAALEAQLSSVTLIPLGLVTSEPVLQITAEAQSLVNLAIEQLVNSWKQQR
jgi:phosphoribosylformylglycinamidine (FGAM) synthase-like enzyme